MLDVSWREAAAAQRPWADVLTRQSATGLCTGPILSLSACQYGVAHAQVTVSLTTAAFPPGSCWRR
jgi:hypothetical protein